MCLAFLFIFGVNEVFKCLFSTMPFLIDYSTHRSKQYAGEPAGTLFQAGQTGNMQAPAQNGTTIYQTYIKILKLRQILFLI